MRWTVMLLGIGLAGCGGGSGYGTGPAGGGYGLPEVVLQPTGETIVPPGRGNTKALAVRTFVPEGEGWSEVTGVPCSVTAAPYLAANLVTPARVVLPDLGPDAPNVQADCRNATLAGSAAVAPQFSWPADKMPSPPARIVWGDWWYGGEKSGPLAYPDLAVALHPTR